MDAIVRKFERGDADAVVRLWEVCGLTRPWKDPRTDIERKLTTQADLFLVLELEGAVIGSALAGYDGHRGSLYYLAVDPAHRTRGYGRLLLTEVEKRLMALGCPKINLMIRRDNKAVQGFYDATGYSADDVIVVGRRMIPDIEG